MSSYCVLYLWIMGLFGILSSQQLDPVVSRLFDKVRSLQTQKDTKPFPPLIWKKYKGVYESDVKLYFHGRPEVALFRDSFRIFDNNMFATAWITNTLLETYKFGNGPKPSEEQILMSLGSIEMHYDRNRNFTNSIMTFWPQKQNSTTKAWESFPENLLDLFALTDNVPWNEIEKFLNDIGLGDIADIVKRLLQIRVPYLHAFLIPPDFDDTFLNFGLGSILAELQSDVPESYKYWQSRNTNITSIFDAMKKYAYRPFSEASKVNSIDPRTYFYIRAFLEDAANNKKDVALVSTWVQDIDEARVMFKKGVIMPGNINNVDVTVCANVIFGITSGILNGLIGPDVLDDADIQQIYLNTSTLIAYQIQTNFSNRQDLALTYYPSEFEFYWFVARTFTALRRRELIGKLPHPAMEYVLRELGAALQGRMWQVIVNASKPDGDDMVFFDDFLGDADLNVKNQTKIRAEDRIFTTSMAVNALVTTWTVFNETQKRLLWDSETPNVVKVTAHKAVQWLKKYALKGTYKPWNTIFSGSYKGFTTIPDFYPANRMEYLNGSKVHDMIHYPGYQAIVAMQGVISEKDYSAMLSVPHFGVRTPLDFPGYNKEGTFFPFWSCEAYTYSTAMLAIASYDNST